MAMVEIMKIQKLNQTIMEKLDETRTAGWANRVVRNINAKIARAIEEMG